LRIFREVLRAGCSSIAAGTPLRTTNVGRLVPEYSRASSGVETVITSAQESAIRSQVRFSTGVWRAAYAGLRVGTAARSSSSSTTRPMSGRRSLSQRSVPAIAACIGRCTETTLTVDGRNTCRMW
jgi:hypothetical protein